MKWQERKLPFVSLDCWMICYFTDEHPIVLRHLCYSVSKKYRPICEVRHKTKFVYYRH